MTEEKKKKKIQVPGPAGVFVERRVQSMLDALARGADVELEMHNTLAAMVMLAASMHVEFTRRFLRDYVRNLSPAVAADTDLWDKLEELSHEMLMLAPWAAAAQREDAHRSEVDIARDLRALMLPPLEGAPPAIAMGWVDHGDGTSTYWRASAPGGMHRGPRVRNEHLQRFMALRAEAQEAREAVRQTLAQVADYEPGWWRPKGEGSVRED